MEHEHVLNLLGVDVHATRDDHELLAVGQVEVPLVVDVADVPQGAPALGVEGLPRLLGVVVVLERGLGTAAEVDDAVLADGELLAVVAADVHLTPDGPADRARVGQGLRRADPRHAHPLGARVVLVDDGTPPLDHPALDLGGAGGGRVHDRAQGRDVGAGPHLVGQLQHAHEHGRDELGVGDPVLLYEPQAVLGVEALHDDHGPAHPLHRHGPDQWGGVVQGGRAEVHVGRPEAHDASEHRRQRGVAPEGLAAEGPPHAFGMAGGARGVEHGEALLLAVEGHVGEAVDELVVGAVAVRGDVAHHEPQVEPGGEGKQVRGEAGQRSGGDQRPGAAVVDDVRRLLGRQVRVDHGVVETGALQPERHLVGAVVVGQDHGDVVPGAEPVGVERLGQPARARLELGEGDHRARRRNDGRAVGVGRRVDGRAVVQREGVGAHRTLLVHAAVAVPGSGVRSSGRAPVRGPRPGGSGLGPTRARPPGAPGRAGAARRPTGVRPGAGNGSATRRELVT